MRRPAPGRRAATAPLAASVPWGSNYGSCVDAYAPGVGIKSALPGSTAAYKDGTSMATPHVAGAGALLKSYSDYTPAWITSWIKTWATAGAVRNVPAGTPNLLLWKGSL